jgi:hypothetical protein
MKNDMVCQGEWMTGVCELQGTVRSIFTKATHPECVLPGSVSRGCSSPWSCVVQDVVGQVVQQAVPAQMDKQHTFDLSDDKRPYRFIAAGETPVRRVTFMKLVKFSVVVFHID